MHFFEAAVAIVTIVMISTVLRSHLKTRSNKSDDLNRNFAKRIDRIEDRLANLETIVLEKERFREFDKLQNSKVS